MAHEFEELALDGHNYPTWALDVKIRLAICGILPALSPPAEREVHFWTHTSTKHFLSSRTTTTKT
jgi:hypothetical protein